MLWLIFFHISALLFWCASLLYLPVLIAGEPASGARARHAAHEDSLERMVYTRVATPAALAAIVMGTLIFLPGYTIDAWLVAKLTLVAALVVCHVLTGSLVLRAEQGARVQPWCTLMLVVLCLLMAGILWLVLAKPSQEALLRL
jgi:putative membrane protein